MKPLSGHSKAILASYRGSQNGLPDKTRRRALAGLHARIAAGVVPAAAVDVAPPEPVSHGLLAQWFGGPLAKIGIGIVVLAVPTALLLSHRSALTVASAGNAQSIPLVAPVAKTHDAIPSVKTIADDAPEKEPSSVPVPERVAVRDRQRPPAKAVASIAPTSTRIVLEEDESPANPDTIDEEVALLSRAHAALRAGRPAEALAELSEHARRFPGSKLGESREATRVLALCASGQKTRARTEAEHFLVAHPASTFATRVRNACTE